MATFEIEENNIQKVKDLLDDKIDVILEKFGLAGEGFAVEEVNKKVYDTPESPNYVRTGDLRKSITHTREIDAGDKVAVIGTNIEYSPYVELGTSKMKARPFIRPAIEEHMRDYEQILREELENG